MTGSSVALALWADHISVGRAHKGKRVLVLVADLDVRVIVEHGVLIRHLELDPSVTTQDRRGLFSEGSRVPENPRHHTSEVFTFGVGSWTSTR